MRTKKYENLRYGDEWRMRPAPITIGITLCFVTTLIMIVTEYLKSNINGLPLSSAMTVLLPLAIFGGLALIGIYLYRIHLISANYMSIDEAAAKIGVSPDRLLRRIATGDLKGTSVSKMPSTDESGWQVHVKDLAEYDLTLHIKAISSSYPTPQEFWDRIGKD